MAAIGFRGIKWFRSPSAWEHTKAWRQSRQRAVKAFQLQAATASAGFTTAFANQISGTAKIAEDAAVKRLQGELKTLVKTVNKTA
jgi:hypothetical protein